MKGWRRCSTRTQRRIIPTTFPAVGFEFTEANYKDIAPRLGATYRLGDKTVLRAGYGIYYNPNQMNSFTFLTNNPPLAAVTTYTSDPANPTLSFDNPSGVAGPITRPDMISPTRELPNARKDQWSFDVQRELGMGMALDLQYVGSHTENLDRSFFNNTPTAGPRRRGPAPAERELPQPPDHRQRPRRRLRRGELHPPQADEPGVADRRALHLVEDKDMATHSNGGGQTMNNYDIEADYGLANWDVPHRFVASYIYDIPFLKDSSNAVPSLCRRRLAGRRV